MLTVSQIGFCPRWWPLESKKSSRLDLKASGSQCSPLPAYSPELQPAERPWPLIRESLANRDLDTLDELEDLLVQRCRYLIENHDVIKATINRKFHIFGLRLSNIYSI